MSDPAMPLPRPPDNIAGAIALLLLSVLCFDSMGVLVRVMQPAYTALELSAYRNVLGVIPSILLMLWTRELRLRGSRLRIIRWRLAFFRGLTIAVAQLLFYTALGRMEFATVSALGLTNALFLLLLSILVLGERAGPWRWSAVVVGFVGAMMILQPGSDAFSLFALLPVAAAFCYALSVVTVRLFDDGVSNALLYLYSSAGSALGAILLAALTTEFTPIGSAADVGLIFLLSMLGGVGALLLSLAYRMAPASVLAPFGYFGLISAFGIGYLVFGEAPVETLFPGVFLIVGAGGVIIWRENRR